MTKTHIMIHHSATADGPPVSWGAIERYHVQEKGWDDVAYHFGVEQVGDRFYALVGRPTYKHAAACYQEDMNKKALHVCCVGNYDLAPPPKWMLLTLVQRVLVPLCVTHRIPVENIVGHAQYAQYKTCPGKEFDLEQLRVSVANKLKL